MFKVAVLDINTATAIYKELVSMVVLPGEEGEFTVLDFHRPIISVLKDGLVKINNQSSIAIKGGVAKMENNELVVLAER